jgi:hypothetical protein
VEVRQVEASVALASTFLLRKRYASVPVGLSGHDRSSARIVTPMTPDTPAANQLGGGIAIGPG